MSKIFLSHTSTDKPFVRKLAADLRRYGHTVWIDEAEINVGDSLIGKIREGLDQVDYVAVILSKTSIKSEWVQREIEIASNREIEEKKVIVLPIIIESISLPGFLKGKLYADFSLEQEYDDKLKLLLRSLGDSKSIVTSNPENKELELIKKELKEAKETIKKYKSHIKRITEHTFVSKSEELKARIEKENENHPEFAPINNVYAFQIDDIPITLGYILHVISKMKRTGAHQFEPFITMNNKWDEVDRMLEAYSDMINRASTASNPPSNNNPSKKNVLPIIALAVSILILLFGNNLIGRLFSQDENLKQPQKSEIEDKAQLPEEKDSDFLNELATSQSNTTASNENLKNKTNEQIAESFLSKSILDDFEHIMRSKDYQRALNILEIAKTKTLQKDLLTTIDNRKKSILLIMEKGFDNVFFSFPAKVVLTVKNDKQGLYTRNGEEIVPPKYDEIDPIFFSPLLLTKSNDKYGFLDEYGKEIFPPIFSDVDPDNFTPLFLVKENGKYGFINDKGKIIVEPRFSDIWGKDMELIKVKQFDKWGFIDTLGREVIKIQYDTIAEFNEDGIAFAKLNGENIFINKNGKKVKNPAFD